MVKHKNFKYLLSSSLAGIVLVGSAFASWENIRPYPTNHEFELTKIEFLREDQITRLALEKVAGRSCANERKMINSELRDIERRLQDAVASGNAQWAQTLREQLRQVNQELKENNRVCRTGG